jgi:hypothetical protein
LHQFRLKGHSLAIDHCEFTQLHAQLRRSATTPCLFYDRDAARFRLSPPSHYPSIDYDWLIQDGAEGVTREVLFAGKPFIGAHSNYGSGGQGQGLRRHRLICLRRLVLRCRLALSWWLILCSWVILLGRLTLRYYLVWRRLSLGVLLLLYSPLDFSGLILLSRYAEGAEAECQA